MIHVTLISKDGFYLEKDVESVKIPSYKGETQVLTAHASYVALIIAGVVELASAGTTEKFECMDGIVEVAHDKMVILVNGLTKSSDVHA